MSQIVTAPSEVLRIPTKSVEALDRRVLAVIKDMEKALKAAKNPQGVGLAAPQIGESLRIFMIRPTKDDPITTFVNPEIVTFSQRTNNPHGKKGVYEGCLSIPQHYAPVVRALAVTVKFQTPVLKGKEWHLVEKQENFSDFPAHVIQHEMDHLNGILFIDRVLEQNAKLYRIDGEEWVEVGL